MVPSGPSRKLLKTFVFVDFVRFVLGFGHKNLKWFHSLFIFLNPQIQNQGRPKFALNALRERETARKIEPRETSDATNTVKTNPNERLV